LRRTTAHAHTSLEDRIGALTSMPAYCNYVRGIHAFRAGLEPALAQVIDAHFSTSLAHLLERDLQDLQLAPLAPLAPPPTCTQDMARALGALYVLAGSALGARVLVKRVEALGLGPTHGARHLWRQAASLETWRQALDLLEGAPNEIDAISAGANAAFGYAQECIMRAHDAPRVSHG
jgi:heme oxygenase